ncbi:hypothetical protein [Cohnella soli]|uniref:GIY-YIG domain-containing protein n=1 Tax=Cohnella soli TaxID=425005 RepID=A0ABW0HPA1_9BACL
MVLPYELTERCVYVLHLEDGCYYIGQTVVEQLNQTIHHHNTNKGSSWTSIHRPIATIEVARAGLCSLEETRILENAFTLQYMARHGWYNVRGGDFHMVDEIKLYKTLYKLSIKGKLGFELGKAEYMSDNYLEKIQKSTVRGPNGPKGFEAYTDEIRKKVIVSIKNWFSNQTKYFSIEQLESIDCIQMSKYWLKEKAPWYGLGQGDSSDVLKLIEYLKDGKIRRTPS